MEQQLAQFGRDLGLHDDFLRDVDARGLTAIVDRVGYVDEEGGHLRMLSLMMELGMWMEEELATGEEVPMGAIGDAVSALARLLGVNPQLAVRIAGASMETWQATLRQLGQKEDEDETANDGRGDGAGHPGGDTTGSSVLPNA